MKHKNKYSITVHYTLSKIVTVWADNDEQALMKSHSCIPNYANLVDIKPVKFEKEFQL